MLQQRIAAGSGATALYANTAPVVSRPSSLLSQHQRCSSSAAASCSGASTSSSALPWPCKQAARGRRAPPALRVAYQDPPKVGPSRMLNIKFTAKSAFETLAGTEAFDLSSFDDNGLYDTASECPHGNVIGIMRAMEKEPGQCSWPPQILTAYPDETLQSLIPRLNKVTGLPVIDRVHGKVVGVISRKDIIKVRNAQGPMDTKVSEKMTSPAITVVSSAPVQEAANLMLNSKIRRLPVVDEEGYAVGIVSRSDIFKPLFREAYNLYMEKEVEALQGRTLNFSPASTFAHTSTATAASPPAPSIPLPSVAAASSAVAAAAAAVVAPFSSSSPSSSSVLAQPVIGWRIKYLYDGDCPMCQSLMNVLRRQDNQRGLIQFVNIADESYNPQNNMGITYDEAMETIHAIHPDGSVVQGTEALKELFSTVGLGWAVYLSDLPIVAKLVDLLYQFLSTHRLSLGGALDGIIAAKRMDMSKQGVETCGDVDDSCNAEW